MSSTRRFATLGFAILLLLTGSAPAYGLERTAPDAGTASGYIIVFDRDADEDVETDLLERFEGFRSEFRYGAALKGFAANLTPKQLARIQKHPRVRIVSPNKIMYAIGPAPVIASEVPTGVRRVESATDTTAAGTSTVGIAVIDTGVDLTHPDLVVSAQGVNCVNGGSPPNDDNGHGSHVAGTIAARNNNAGVIGVAPGSRIHPVKVLNAAGSGTWAQIICGIDWVTANAATLGIKVANMSLGGQGTTNYACDEDALHQAICNSTAAGVTYVVAAGNSAQDLFFHNPANYPEVLTVTAASDSDGRPGALGPAPACRTAERDDRYASFSNFADPAFPEDVAHTISGPGVCIRSTYSAGGYATISGTSMASPHVAGTVALCLGSGGIAGPCAGLTPAQIINKMRSDAAAKPSGYGFTGDPWRPIAGRYYGYLTSAAPYLTLAPDTTAPVISNVQATGITATAATISWTTDEASDSQVDYRAQTTTTFTSTPVSQTTGVTSHSVALAALSPGTTYVYRVRSADLAPARNTSTSADLTFTTATPDTTPPLITNVQATVISQSAATISWATNEASDSQVDYRKLGTTAFTSTPVSQTSGVTSHSVGLSGLLSATTYEYKVRSKDAAGNTAESAIATFTTAAAPADTTAPTITNVQRKDLTDTSVRITWTTNELATSQVEFGETTGYGSLSPLDTTRRTSHSLTLAGLTPETVYHYRVLSRDAAGNLARSADRTFETDPPAGSD